MLTAALGMCSCSFYSSTFRCVLSISSRSAWIALLIANLDHTKVEPSSILICTLSQKSLELQKRNPFSAGKDMAVVIGHSFSWLACNKTLIHNACLVLQVALLLFKEPYSAHNVVGTSSSWKWILKTSWIIYLLLLFSRSIISFRRWIADSSTDEN